MALSVGRSFCFLACFVAASLAASAQMSCLSPSGSPVDWYVVMKFPQKVGQYPGYTAAYIDSTNPIKSAIQVSDFHYSTNNAVAETVKQLGIYGGKVTRRTETLGWAFWNDETFPSFEAPKPIEHWNNSQGYDYGHTKGVLAFNAASKSGFYLLHSAPGFPYSTAFAPDYFHFPYGQSWFAQHFFCVSLTLDQIEAASAVMRYYNAYVYDSNIPPGLTSRLPNFVALTKFEYKNGSTTGSVLSVGSQQFTLIGKDGNVNGDLYEDYVAPALKSGLTSMTWCCGDFDPFCCMPSYCKGKPIQNPSGPQKGRSTYAWDSTNLLNIDYGQGLVFNVSQNHAKFAVNDNANGSPWVCFGDMNRMTSQRKRGGGAMCQQNTKLFAFMKGVITKYDQC